MKRFIALSIAAAMVCTSAISEASIIRFDTVPSFAPNAFGSPSWSGYVSNAHTALMGNPVTNVGDRTTDPTAFELVDSANPTSPIIEIDPKEMIVTTFNSWRGTAPPVGAAFAAELGNRVQFGFALETDGNGQINIANLLIGWTKHWMDNDAEMGTSSIILEPLTQGSFSADTYTAETIGVLYGDDGALGGGDDTILTSGTGLVDAIYSVGVGDGLLPEDVEGATDQEKIDLFVANLLAADHPPQKLTTSYTVTLDVNEQLMSAATIFLTPEPGSLVTITPAIAVLAAFLRRRRKW